MAMWDTSINRLSVAVSASWAGSASDIEPDKNEPQQRSKYLIDHGPKYEALDILTPDSNAFKGMKYTWSDQVMNWINFFLIGLITGIVAFGIDVLTTILTHWRQTTPQHIMNRDLDSPLDDH